MIRFLLAPLIHRVLAYLAPDFGIWHSEFVVSPVSSVSSVSFIQSLTADKHALHDIRFRFKVDNIWSVIINNHPELKPNDFSKDISIDPLETHGLTIKTTIHHTDTVSVIVACSQSCSRRIDFNSRYKTILSS